MTPPPGDLMLAGVRLVAEGAEYFIQAQAAAAAGATVLAEKLQAQSVAATRAGYSMDALDYITRQLSATNATNFTAIKNLNDQLESERSAAMSGLRALENLGVGHKDLAQATGLTTKATEDHAYANVHLRESVGGLSFAFGSYGAALAFIVPALVAAGLAVQGLQGIIQGLINSMEVANKEANDFAEGMYGLEQYGLGNQAASTYLTLGKKVGFDESGILSMFSQVSQQYNADMNNIMIKSDNAARASANSFSDAYASMIRTIK